MFLTSDQRVIALLLAASGHRGEDIADLSVPPPPPLSPSQRLFKGTPYRSAHSLCSSLRAISPSSKRSPNCSLV